MLFIKEGKNYGFYALISKGRKQTNKQTDRQTEGQAKQNALKF